MPASYPSAVASLPKPTSSTLEDDSGFEHDIVHSNVAYEIEAIETTLGISPQGGSATVVARLNANDTAVSAKPSATASNLFLWRTVR